MVKGRKYITEQRSQFITGVLLVSPALLFLLVFVMYPLLRTIVDSLFKFSLISPELKWVGFNNYIELFSDDIFYLSILNNVIVAILSIIIQVSLGIILAAVTIRGMKAGSALARTIIFMPIVFSTVGIALLWGLIYDMNVGQLVSIFEFLNLPIPEKGFLGSHILAVLCIILAGSWQATGFIMVIMIAAMVNISEEIYDAAKLEGATALRQFFSLTLPNCKNAIVLCILLTIIGAFKFYDLVKVLTNTGPNHKTEVIGTYIVYNAFNLSRMGYADAVSVILLIIAALVGSLQVIVNKRNLKGI